MSERFENTFIGHNGAELFYQTWEPANPRGTIVVTHGLAEHSDCYQSFADELTPDQWRVVAWDLRGHGRSAGKRGYVEEFDHFCEDLNILYSMIKKQRGDQPVIPFGHSLGGLITLKTQLRFGLSDAPALCLSSPCLGLNIEIPKLKEKFAELASDWLPKTTLANEISYEALTRNRQLHEEYAHDTLRHDRISPRLFVGMRDSFNEVQEHALEFTMPLLMQLAGEEKVVNTQASQAFYDRVGSKQKEIHIYNESYHEIFNDLDRADVFADFKNFINKL